MTYRIEITAETVSELAGRVLAMAAQFQTTTAQGEVNAAPKKVTEKKTVSEKAPEPIAETAVEAPEPAVESVEAVSAYDYKSDVVPRVLALVEAKGRDVMENILTTFGVARASEISQELLGEFLAAIDEAMGA